MSLWNRLRTTLFAFTLLMLAGGCSGPDSTRQPESGSLQEIIIRGGWIFDGISDTRSRNRGILIRDGKFIDVGADLTGRSFPDAKVIELDDTATILPGMFDLHAHYNLDLVDVGRAEDVTYNPLIFLANGVTSTWSAGEFFPERIMEARDRVERGEAIGPRIFASGPYFGAFRCEYQIQTAEDDCAAWPNDITEEEIRAEVNEWAARGVKSIKIKQASPSEAQILIDQAHKRGMTTAGHLANYKEYYDVDPKEAIRMGIDRIEHRLTLGSEKINASELETAIPVGLAAASPGPFIGSRPLKPSAKTLQSPLGFWPERGTKVILNPSWSNPRRFHDPWKARKAPPLYESGNWSPP